MLLLCMCMLLCMCVCVCMHMGVCVVLYVDECTYVGMHVFGSQGGVHVSCLPQSFFILFFEISSHFEPNAR